MLSGSGSAEMSEMEASEINMIKNFIGLIGAIGALGILRSFAFFFLNPEAFFICSFLLLLTIGLYAEKVCLENATLNRKSLKTKPIESETETEVEIQDIFVRNKGIEEKSESECEIGIANNEPKSDTNQMVKIKNDVDAVEPAVTNSELMNFLLDGKYESGDCC